MANGWGLLKNGEFGQWRTFWAPTHKTAQEIHPDLTMEEILEKYNATRTVESRELWKRLDIVNTPA